MATTGFEVTGLAEFVADLHGMPDLVHAGARRVLERAAVNIKRQLRGEMGASRHFGQVARAISYDIIDRIGYVEAEIGPTKGSPGSLANIAYFGTSRGGGTVPDPDAALQAEVPNMERELADLVARSLL